MLAYYLLKRFASLYKKISVPEEQAAPFKDLNPNRAKAWCRGGGGGAKIIISPCENRRLQFDSLNARYNLGLQVKSKCQI
ncbi:MAG: hypothetical protein PHR39_07375 [Actinomycetota bacterium]|nr:hypothetical protein [Actinomycetota bacterium]